jgi:hypothetical protein
MESGPGQADTQGMRKTARTRLDLATMWPIVGTSLMTVVAGPHGFDDLDAVEALPAPVLATQAAA